MSVKNQVYIWYLKIKNIKKFFKEHIYSTSDCSGFLINKKKVENIYEFKKGNWWIQDSSSSFL